MKLQFKKATLDDLEILQQISIDTFKATYESKNDPQVFKGYLERAFNTEVFKKELVNPEIDFYLAFTDKELVGYFKINEAASQTDIKDFQSLEIERIYLKQKHQGFGFGRQLIEAVIQIAKQRQKDYVWLGVWTENPNAIAFYKKMDFVIFDKHSFRIGQELQDDFLMKLVLIK